MVSTYDTVVAVRGTIFAVMVGDGEIDIVVQEHTDGDNILQFPLDSVQ